MPVGVPKVPFHIPGDEEASWVDIYNRLSRQGFLFILQEIDSEISNQIVGLMVFLALEGEVKDLYFWICSPGGSIINGFAIYDMMIYLPQTMHTISIGESASMASLILAGGTITQRVALPHTRIMIHQPRISAFQIPAGESLIEMEEFAQLRNLVGRAYAKRTGQPLWVVEQDLERDIFMSAQEAKDYGIVDLVGSGE
uniref:ATP-dependent Clp protease proteolytic subunit n=2 Tax=Triosteum TaxID=105269 RepID=A0A2U8XIM0_9DIPS|nr:clp protease proteolytic subunit protein [Triosteum pinnatifidum]YP_009711151.1 clp protease proteolytic subunit protein [Triosteum himalayanum]AWN57845.1 clp protease proteolytic subunit protein [Triosteum pinnatifidum]QGI24566.1 clp protease proteolytic subunit protein [Triosteum himalayanum]URQ21515.1 clp protease proteolytic subunit [Triosteum pinnatifidum]